MTDTDIGRIHFVGVGGAGLSGLARLSLALGHEVSGSDRQRSAAIGQLEALGLRFQEGHEPGLVRRARTVVASSAIAAGNPELAWARANGLRLWKRHQFLPWLARGRRMVAVAGTHGKTTVTALLSHVLLGAGLDPTCLVGGVVRHWGHGARLGGGDLFVLEADEYDRTFLSLEPSIGAITSIEMDHPDCYPTMADLEEAFARFAAGCGLVVGCIDDPRAAAVLAALPAERHQGYGWSAGADWRIESWQGDETGSSFRLRDPGGAVHEGRVPLWGEHAVANAAAVVALASACGLTAERALAALDGFAGVERRLSVTEAGGVTLIDDYAHHPTQLTATMAAARQRYPGRRVVLVWQPHTFSRLEALYDEFVAALRRADLALVLPVYGARERGDSAGASARVAAAVGGRALPLPAQAAPVLASTLAPGDVVLNLGAGDGPVLTATLVERLGGAGAEKADG